MLQLILPVPAGEYHRGNTPLSVRHINVILCMHAHKIPITKCSLVSPGPKHSSAINIAQREISIVSLCA